MKLRVYSALVLFLFVTLFVFAVPCNAQGESGARAKLEKKIEEIKVMLDYLLNKQTDQDLVESYVTQLIKKKPDIMLKHDTSTLSATDSNIVAHVKSLCNRPKGVKIEVRSEGFSSVEQEHVDFKAIAVITFIYEGSPGHTDTLEVGLWHLRICIWW